MEKLLRSMNLVTKFQILVEVAQNQPDVQQRDIGKRLGLSPQAMSDYFKELLEEGWVVTEGRAKHRITREGVAWLLRGLREWQGYSEIVQRAIAGISVCAAVAASDLSEGQRVGLCMRDGMLYATENADGAATAEAVTSARMGEDVGVSRIEGIVPLDPGRVTIVRAPSIRQGGSRCADLRKVRKATRDKDLVAAIGIEAVVAMRKAGCEPPYVCGVASAVVEAATSGQSCAVICVEDDIATLIGLLEDKRIQYEIVDARLA